MKDHILIKNMIIKGKIRKLFMFWKQGEQNEHDRYVVRQSGTRVPFGKGAPIYRKNAGRAKLYRENDVGPGGLS